MTEDIGKQLGFDFSGPSDMDYSAGSRKLLLPDADVVFYPNFFSESEGQRLFQRLFTEVQWQQDQIKFYGKEVKLPRLTAWFGDAGKSYTYSHIMMNALPWTPLLLDIKSKVEAVIGISFNCVLLNLYRDGNDGVAWHSDDEPELGKSPAISSVSFGQTRKFQFRHKFKNESGKFELFLNNGSLLVMKGMTQQFWQHQIPKTSKEVRPRINLTFRIINS